MRDILRALQNHVLGSGIVLSEATLNTPYINTIPVSEQPPYPGDIAPGVLLHGVATRPGKPTIVGVVQGKPVLGLPGNPVSAMIQFDMFGVPAIYRLQGAAQTPRRAVVYARLAHNLASETGREDYVPTRLEETAEGLVARPVFGKSNLIYTLVHADGLIKIPLNKGGIPAGELVEVRLF